MKRLSLLVGLVVAVTAVLPTVGALASVEDDLACSSPVRDEPVEVARARWLDRCGKVFFAEQVPAPTTPEAPTPPLSEVTAAQAFSLHSRPGSHRVIHLDFLGQALQGTGWNDSFAGGADLALAAYDTDGDPSTFGAEERAAVVATWQRVAEDYAPFDVDVTTEDPGDAAITRDGSSDLDYGTRAVITNTSLDCGGCAGIAYLSVFDMSWDHGYAQPALVFASRLYGSDKLLGEVASHEVGHNLGLSHDGSATSGYYGGHGSWMPVMGGSGYRPVSQWSAGEYDGATTTQDDVAVIAAHGTPLAADDHGDSAATATPLLARAAGTIGTRTDTDWFAFQTAGGEVTLTGAVAKVGADLDLRIDLLDAAGAVVASADPAASTGWADPPTGLSATLTATVPGGTYFARLDGVGSGTPSTGWSDYGSLGRYALALTVAAPVVAPPPVVHLAPVVTTTALPGATAGRPYAAALAATGTGPLTWSATGLPAGVVLSSTGVLSGTPTTAGTRTVTLTVRDAAGVTGTRSLALKVAAAPVVSTWALPGARRGTAYATALAATGGTPGLTWKLVGGTLPTGMGLTSTGVLRGTPAVSTTRTLTFQVTDARGALARRSLLLVVR